MTRVGYVVLGLAVLFLLALAIVWSAGRLSPAYTMDVGGAEWGRIQRANDWEDSGTFTYRWTKEVTRFRLPVLGAPRRLVLRLAGARPAGIAPAEVSLYLDGQAVASFLPPAEPQLYHVVYDGASPWSWETVVALQTEPFQPPGDARDLGVVLDRLHFSRPVGQLGPAWLLVLLWAALGLAVVALGRLLGWPWEWAGVLATLLMLGLGVLLAWSRPIALPWAGLVLVISVAGVLVALLWRASGPTLAGRQLSSSPDGRGRTRWLKWRRSGAGRRWLTPFVLFCLGLALVVVVLPLLAPWLPEGGSWALHMLRPFYPAAGPIPRQLGLWLPLLVMALAALPRVVNQDLRSLGWWVWEAGRWLTPRLRPAGRWLLLGLLFVPLGYALRSRVLWGDGPHLIAHIAAGYRFKEPEILAFFVQAMFYRWTESLWGWSVPDVYTCTSLVAGALYVALAAALSDALGQNRFGRSFIFGLLVTLATIQFGFGYLENYAFVTVALLGLFWQMVRCLQGRGSPGKVVALWVLACAGHLQALTVGPAVLFTVVRAWKEAPSTAVRRRQVGAVLAGLIVPSLVVGGLLLAGGYEPASLLRGGWRQGNNPYLFVPLRSADTYTLFSLRHLANVLNEHVLVAPVVLPLLLGVLLWYRRRVPWREPVFWALGLSAVGLLLFASTIYPDLGPQMDWDLLAPAAIPYTLLTGFIFLRAVPEEEGKRYGATVLLVSAGMHALTWVLLNARML